MQLLHGEGLVFLFVDVVKNLRQPGKVQIEIVRFFNGALFGCPSVFRDKFEQVFLRFRQSSYQTALRILKHDQLCYDAEHPFVEISLDEPYTLSVLFKRDPRSLSLTTERLVIRLPQRGDEGAIARYYEENQAFLQPWAPSLDETYFDARAWRERIDAIISEFKHGRGARLIFLPYDESHEVLGMASLTNITGFPSYSCQLG